MTSEGDAADYLVTGSWSKKAIAEAQRLLPGTNQVGGGGGARVSLAAAEHVFG